jgi:hypothetical protein
MQILHLESDSLHLAARTLMQEYYHIADRAFALRIQYYRVEMAWQGGRANEYLYELDLLFDRLRIRMDELLTLSRILYRQAETWDESDQRWAGAYRELTVPRSGE